MAAEAAQTRALIEDVRGFLASLTADFPSLFARSSASEPGEAGGREKARAEFETQAALWSARMGVRYRRIAIKDQRTLWGSCSRAGNLNFNWRLILAPPPVLEYVVIHELAHLAEMNHSKRFWNLVGLHCPDYRERRRWLREHQDRLRPRHFPALKAS